LQEAVLVPTVIAYWRVVMLAAEQPLGVARRRQAFVARFTRIKLI
jgi:hypothetical protein